MLEMMFDLETLDTKPSAVVLSVGAVVWETFIDEAGDLDYGVHERFYRVVDMQEQLNRGRTISQDTLLWWLRQDPTARAEAFNPVRQSVDRTLSELNDLARNYDITKFWASPDTFDFPIWDDLAFTFQGRVPWSYNQKYDVRTVVNEASYSARDHRASHVISGLPHMPVYDCEWQIELLTGARNRIQRRIY